MLAVITRRDCELSGEFVWHMCAGYLTVCPGANHSLCYCCCCSFLKLASAHCHVFAVCVARTMLRGGKPNRSYWPSWTQMRVELLKCHSSSPTFFLVQTAFLSLTFRTEPEHQYWTSGQLNVSRFMQPGPGPGYGPTRWCCEWKTLLLLCINKQSSHFSDKIRHLQVQLSQQSHYRLFSRVTWKK